MTSNTRMRDFNRAILEYFSHPGRHRGTTAEFGYRALDSVLSAETKLLIVDDLHFLKWRNKSGIEVSNHFKYIANEFPVTLLMVGVSLENRGLFSEGASYVGTQLLDRVKNDAASERARREWQDALEAGRLVSRPGQQRKKAS
ncbi:TniB family NTP-binding protein [Streptomyces griseoviridis]